MGQGPPIRHRKQRKHRKFEQKSASSVNWRFWAAAILWIGPPLLASVLLAWANVDVHKETVVVSHGDLGDQTEKRTVRGRPFIAASLNPNIDRWDLDLTGISIDALFAVAAVATTAVGSKYWASIVDMDVNSTLWRKMRRLFNVRARPDFRRQRTVRNNSHPRHGDQRRRQINPDESRRDGRADTGPV